MKQFEEKYGPGFSLVFHASEVFVDKQTPFQKLSVFQTDTVGRVMLLDDLVMVTEHDEMYYHESIVHPVAQRLAQLKRVLVIGGGDGGTAREALKYDIDTLIQVEIDGDVVAASKDFLPTMACSYDDPRMELVIGDGCAWVEAWDGAPFDLVLVDSSEPIGPNGTLFTPEFYSAIRKLLTDDGQVVVQAGSPAWQAEELTDIRSKLQHVFGNVQPYTGFTPTYPGGHWTFYACGNKPIPQQPARTLPDTRWTTEQITGAMLAMGEIVVRGIQTDITTDEIVGFVREGREPNRS